MKENYIIDETKNRIELLDSRFYQDQETKEFFPSVTTILDAYPKSYAFYEWLKVAGAKADEIRDEFGNRGSTVHRLTEIYDLGEKLHLMDENNRAQYSSMEWAMFERYIEFCDRFKPDIKVIEAHYCSSKLGFGGTLDRVIELNGETILLDIKTSNAIHNHYWLQQAAYVKLWEEKNRNSSINKIAILWLNARTRTDGKGDAIQGKGWQMIFSPKSIDDQWKLFQATHALWLQENKDLKPKNTVYQLTHVKNLDNE